MSPILFCAITLDKKDEKPIVLLENMRKAAIFYNLAHPDQEIMRVLYSGLKLFLPKYLMGC